MPATDLLRHRPQPGPGDVGDGREPGEVGVRPRPGRLGGVDRDAPPGAPSAAFASATAWPVVPLPAKKSSTRRRPATCRGSAASARSASATRRRGRRSPSARRPRCRSTRSPRPARWCAASCAVRRAASPSGTRRPARRPPVTRRHTRSSGRSSISGAATSAIPPVVPSPKTGPISTAPSNGAVRTAPGHRVAPHREVQGARGDRVELLVGVAQREAPVAAPVSCASGKSRRRPSRRCSRRARTGGCRGRRPGGTRGWSRTPGRAGGPWR